MTEIIFFIWVFILAHDLSEIIEEEGFVMIWMWCVGFIWSSIYSQ